MKVLGIVCSPRRRGNTEILISEALAGAKECGATVEMINVAQKKIAFCDACESCIKKKKCRINDDMQDIYTLLLEANAIIFGTPVYFWNVTAQGKTLIDRTYALYHGYRLRNKLAGVIAVGRRSGADIVVNNFYSFFNMHRMIIPTSALIYSETEDIERDEKGGYAIAYAGERGEVRQDLRGMAQARALGNTIAKFLYR